MTNLHPDFIPYEALVEAGYLSRSESGDLILYNYTDKCTFEKYWNRYTLCSRGTIYNRHTGEVVARAFGKFFNIGELENGIDSLPNLPFTAAIKEDGSLGILYKHEGNWAVATRGSFGSDQAMWATKHLHYTQDPIGSPKFAMNHWPSEWTPLVEIVYPDNRIIVDYGDREDLILLAARHKQTGKYMPEDMLNKCGDACGFTVRASSEANLDQMIEMAKTIPHNHEGWVLTYSDGFMVKIKGAKYLELARFKAHLNPLHVWDIFVNGEIMDFMKTVPEEFETEAWDMHGRLLCQFTSLSRVAEKIGHEIGVFEDLDTKDKALMKEKAELIKQQPKWMHGYLFGIMRRDKPLSVKEWRQVSKPLWSHIRPSGGVYVDIGVLLNESGRNP